MARKTAATSSEDESPQKKVAAGDEGTRLDGLLESKVVKDILKAHGSSILTRASEAKIVAVPRIPTGIFQVDAALGGGVPAGRVSIAYGMKSSGKTTLWLRTMGQSQKMCANCYKFFDPESGKCGCRKRREHVCAFLDVEGSWDAAWATAHGVDTSKVLLSVPEYAEQTLDIADALIRSTEIDLLVIDSLAFLTPAKEIEESSGKALQAEQARTLGRGIRKFVSGINYVGNKTGRRPTLLCTNQIRMKIGVMFGNPETQPGGFAPGFAASTELKCWSGKYDMNETTGRPVSVKMNFRVEKNKVSSAKMEGEYSIMLAETPQKKFGDIYDEPDIVELALRVGLIEKESNQAWTCLGETYRGKSLIVSKMCEDAEFKRKVCDSLMHIITGS